MERSKLRVFRTFCSWHRGNCSDCHLFLEIDGLLRHRRGNRDIAVDRIISWVDRRRRKIKNWHLRVEKVRVVNVEGAGSRGVHRLNKFYSCRKAVLMIPLFSNQGSLPLGKDEIALLFVEKWNFWNNLEIAVQYRYQNLCRLPPYQDELIGFNFIMKILNFY